MDERDAYHSTSPFPTILVGNPWKTESANDSSCLKEAIGGGDQVGSVWTSVELEVSNE